MAVNEKSPQAQQLNPVFARAAGLASALVAFVGMGGVLACLMMGWAPQGAAQNGLLGLACAMAIIVACGVQLLRGQVWAQAVLLAFWLLVAVAAVVATVTVVVSGIPPWWHDVMHLPVAAVIGGLLAIGSLEAYIAALASAANSRLRYGTLVTVSVAAALGALLVVNLIAQGKDNYLRRDIESLGQYRLSERSIKILKGVNEPVRVTVVYTSADPRKKSAELRPRVWELLNEMHEQNPRIEVVNATGDTEKAEILYRLANQQNKRAAGHIKALELFVADANELAGKLMAQQQDWDALAGKSYLDAWGATAQISANLGAIAKQLIETSGRVQKELAGLPDHAKLIEDAKKDLEFAQKNLKSMGTLLAEIAKVPASVQKNKAAALESVDAAVKGLENLGKEVSQDLGGDNTKAAGILKAFVDSAAKAADAAQGAAQKLDEIAGPENADLIRSSRPWLVDSGEQPTMIGNVALVSRQVVSDEFARTAQLLLRLKKSADMNLKNAKTEFQASSLTEMAKVIAQSLKGLQKAQDAAKAAVAQLAAIDAPTQKLLKDAPGGKMYDEILKPGDALLEEIAKLPPLGGGALSNEVTEDNIIIVETTDRTEIVPFDQVWPLKSRPSMNPMMPNPDLEEQRVFNGDAAISSKILAATQKPFARVLITYLQAPPQMQRMAMGPQSLTELKRRLEQSNVKVEDWDLAKPMPEDANDTGSVPTVLLILPPPPAMPPMGQEQQQPPQGFTKEHMAKVNEALDSGASGIFLAHYLEPIPMGFMGGTSPREYPWNEYLRQEWGLDCMTNFLIIPALPDKDAPNKYLISGQRFYYLPLSNYSSQPIGKPLQGQRTLWTFMCPIQKVAQPQGVTAEPILTIPGDWRATWATSNIERILDQIRTAANSNVVPDYEGGDMKVPFTVAMAATRTASGKDSAKPARVVVLTNTFGFQDGYLDERVRAQDTEGAEKSFDPPRANADLLINSVYWLSGHEDYIASGPIQLQPVKEIGPGTRNALWALCVILLPALVIGLGVMVMVIRKR